MPTDEYQAPVNRSGQTLSNGHVVIVDTSNSESITVTSTAGDTKFRGIVMESLSNTSSGVVKTHGYIPSILLEISASAGTFLRCSSASGKAEPGLFRAGTFAIVTTPGTASAGAYVFGTSDTFTPTTTNALTGATLQVVYFQTSATASSTTTMAYGTGKPQNTEGIQVASAAITPYFSTSTLIIDAIISGCHSVNASKVTVALFQDAGASAISVQGHRSDNSGEINQWSLRHIMSAGTTASAAFYLRAGSDTAGNIRINYDDTPSRLGGALISNLSITEVKG